MITVQDILRRLTDVYKKDPNSNIGKLISIMSGQLTELEDTNNRIRDWRDIDKAQGKTLDRLGENVVQPRGAAADEVYRILIKSKIARNLSKGDINTIISVLATALGVEYREITITEMYDDQTSPEPAAIKVIQLPIARLNEVGMDPVQFTRIVQKTVAAGVRVGAIELTGTFRFSSIPTESEYSDTGFSDSTGTTGGTLGAVYSPGVNVDLPI